jgi:hypothetical protein
LKEENQSTGSENKENITSKILINGCRWNSGRKKEL